MTASAILDGATLAVTGGTGSLATAIVSELLTRYSLRKIILFSRSESRQAAMKQRYPETPGGPLRYFVGDVRDRARLVDAFEGADIVIHAAALKRVEVCEREPKEAVLTNIMGTLNACEAARIVGAHRFMFISSDKACAACTTYGATKYAGERLTVGMNNYRGGRDIRYSCVRYGNVLGSTGSVLQTFRAADGKVPITHPDMTRFWLTPTQAARFVLSSLAMARGGEVFVPKVPSAKIIDLATAFAQPFTEWEVIGLRGAEKIGEALVSPDEGMWTIDIGDRYAILPADPQWPGAAWPGHERMPAGWCYTSAGNDTWLTCEELRRMADG